MRPVRASSGGLLRLNVLLFLASGSTGLVNYLYHVVVGHLLSPAAYGTVAALTNLSNIALIPTTIVLTVFTRAAAALSSSHAVGQLRDIWIHLTRWLLAGGLAAALIFSIGLSSVVARFFGIPREGGTVALLGTAYIVGFALSLNLGLLQGMQRFGWYAAITAGSPVLRVVLATFFILAGWGASGAVLGLAVASVLPYALSFLPARAAVRHAARRPGNLRPWITFSMTVAVATIASTLLANFDLILVKHFLPASDAGNYAALATTGKMVLYLGGSVGIVMFPKVAAAQARGERHGDLLGFSLAAVLVLSLIALVPFTACPAFILTHLFGPAYADLHGYLPWYGLAMLFFALSSALIQYFLALGRRAFLWPVLACCLLQAGALWAWHAGVGQILLVMVISMGMLLLSLTWLCIVTRGPGHETAGIRTRQYVP